MGGYLAHISPISPYGGQPDAIHKPQQQPHLDWALLEVTDADQRPSFETETPVLAGANAVKGTQCRIIGYPNGAGWERELNTWRVGGHYLANSSPVEPFSSDTVTIDKEEGDFLKYRGAVEARPGMSGGGVFSAGEDALVGIHRSRHDPSLKAEALSFAAMIDWLYEHRHVRPVYLLAESPPVKPPRLPLGWLIGAGISIALGLAAWLWPTPQTYVWRGVVVQYVNGQATPVPGVQVTPFGQNRLYTELSTITKVPDGDFEIQTTEPALTEGAIKLRFKKEGFIVTEQESHALSDFSFERSYTIRQNLTQ